MFKKNQKRFVAFILVTLGVFLSFGEGYAAPTVRLTMNPDKTEFPTGAEPVALTARASGTNLEFTWKLTGPGTIEGTGPSVIYKVPNTISGTSAQVKIKVIVRDATGQETTESVNFKIIAESTTSSAKPKSKKGMSKTTKILLGAGAAAAVVGGLALAAGGGDDSSSSGPFTGTFRWEHTGQTTTGIQTFWTEIYTLTQNGNAITGNLALSATLPGCCTASFTVPVTGTANGTSAIITDGAGEATCQCSVSIYSPSYGGGTYNVTLINNGSTLRFEGGVEYIRTSKVTHGEVGDELYDRLLRMGGDFIRQ